jgi:hypothetical protein
MYFVQRNSEKAINGLRAGANLRSYDVDIAIDFILA